MIQAAPPRFRLKSPPSPLGYYVVIGGESATRGMLSDLLGYPQLPETDASPIEPLKIDVPKLEGV